MRTVASHAEDTVKGKATDQSGAEQWLHGQKRGKRAGFDGESMDEESDECGPMPRNSCRLRRRTKTRGDQGARQRTGAPHGGGLAKGDQGSDDDVSVQLSGVDSARKTGGAPVNEQRSQGSSDSTGLEAVIDSISATSDSESDDDPIQLKRDIESWIREQGLTSDEGSRRSNRSNSSASESEPGSDAGIVAEAEAEATADIERTTTPTDNGMTEFVCGECQRRFSTKAGMQLHRKRTHPVAYNLSLPEPSERAKFPTDVLKDIAEACLEWPGRATCGKGVSQFVCSRFPAYSADQINALRKRPRYREIERLVRTERAALNAEGKTPQTPPQTPGETPHVAGGCESDSEDGTRPSEGDSSPSAGSRTNRVARPENLATEAAEKAWHFYEGVCGGGDISALFEELMKDLAPGSNKGGRRARPSRGSAKRQGPKPPEQGAEEQKPANRSQRKRARYALHQKLYRKSQAALMSELREPGTSGNTALPDTADVARIYGERFGSESPHDNQAYQSKADSKAVDLGPFTEDEVLGIIKGLNRESAPGPDCVTGKMIVGWGVNVIRPIVNSFLYAGKIPDQLRINRTTLIPKVPEPASVNDYRPITIGSLIHRVYAKLLTKRLNAQVELDPRQKAFVPVDGCSEHTFVVGEALEQCRKQRKECNLVFLDLAKAFDMVSHCSIRRALERFGVGPGFVEVVDDLYTGISTVIRGMQGPTDPIKMTRGVKQGCPLSPILFNMVMDELVDRLGSRHGLKPRQDLEGFTTLAFADDLVLASGTVHGMTQLLATVREFFEARSMSVNAAKSHTIRLAPAPGTRTVKVVGGTTFSYGGVPIPNRSINESVKYLGLAFSPTGPTSFQRQKAVSDLKLIQRAALKPEQKLDMIRRLLLPTQMHVLRLSRRVLLRELRQLDRVVRRTARGILHLPPGTPTAFFYMKAGDGGLALPEAYSGVGYVRLKRLVRLKASGDRLVASYARVSVSLERELRHWVGALGFEDTSLANITRASKNRHVDRAKAYRTTQVGRLFDAGGSNVGHSWLTRPQSLRGGDYVTAVKMVSENLPTRINVTRGRGEGRRECRRCRGTAETQLHALNECRATRDAQIRRHNWVCGLLRERALTAEANATVMSEHRVSVNGEEYRPDLIVVSGNRATVVDVAVCYDNRADRLRARYRDKVRKYEAIREALREQLNSDPSGGRSEVTEVVVDAFVVGSRGLILLETCGRSLQRYGMRSRTFLRRVQEGVVRGSVTVWRTFTC